MMGSYTKRANGRLSAREKTVCQLTSVFQSIVRTTEVITYACLSVRSNTDSTVLMGPFSRSILALIFWAFFSRIQGA